MCVQGARWVAQNVLEKYADQDIAVYAVWFNMVSGDRRDRWNPTLLYDERITHYWDENRVLGRWVSEHVDACEHLGPIDWDSYYLFDGNGKWTETFEGLKACGTPIYKTTEPLARAAEEILGKDGND